MTNSHFLSKPNLRLTTSENLLSTIQEKIKWADSMSELDLKHKKEVEERIEEVKKTLPHKVSSPPKSPVPRLFLSVCQVILVYVILTVYVTVLWVRNVTFLVIVGVSN